MYFWWARTVHDKRVSTFHKYIGVEAGYARAREQFEPVGLRDSLTLEGLCLLGFGVAGCFLLELTAMDRVLLRWLRQNCGKCERMRHTVARNKVSVE